MSGRFLVNGEPADQIPLSDRGLHYGDGLFETIAIIDSTPRFWQRHMARLSRGEAVLGLPQSDKSLLLQEALQLSKGSDQGVLKIILTRGSGGRGYRPPAPCEPRRILSIHHWPDYPDRWFEKGIALRICDTRLSRNSRLAGIKHLNRLEQVLARQEWQDGEIPEGLMLDEYDRVICGTQSNLFLQTAAGLVTPDIRHAGVAGIMREVVTEAAGELGMETRTTTLELSDLKQAEALFVTNSLLGLCPVRSVADQSFDIARISPRLRQTVHQMISNGTRL